MMIVSRNGLDMLFAALRNHPTHADVNHWACRALANIPVLQRATIEKSGGLATLQAAMSRFPDDADIQAEGRRLIGPF
jgi:hypothetical protein